jgi:hypothetical protein
MIVYVETLDTSAGDIESDIARTQGTGNASVTVTKWFDLYSEFVYDSETGDLIMFKKRAFGYWESVRESLCKYRFTRK